MSVRPCTIDKLINSMRLWEASQSIRYKFAREEWVVSDGHKGFARRIGVTSETVRKALNQLDNSGRIILLRGSPFKYRFPVSCKLKTKRDDDYKRRSEWRSTPYRERIK